MSLASAGALQCLGHAGFAPARACGLSPSTLLRLQVALPELSEAGPGLRALPRPKRLRVRFSTKGQTWRDLRFVPVPGPSSSGDQVLGGRGLPQLGAASSHLPYPSHSVFWVYNLRTFSAVPCVSSGELISGCDPPSRYRPARIPRSLG